MAGIGGRGGGGDFGEIRGRSFRHACWAWGVAFVGRSGFACRRADEPTSRRADEPTSRRADEPTSRRADEPTSRRADEPTSRHADTPTRRHADTPTRRHADTPTRRHADTPTRRHADTPTRRHADGSTVPSVYESIPVSPMQSSRLTDSPIYRFASACRAAVPRPSGAERSIIGSRVHNTPTRRPPAVARPFEAARRRRHIRRASRPTAVHSLEAHRRRKP
ncbi:SR protein factor [Burkholderia pseudomallei]|uniref:SR protein factor n=1 Tax=Burkholderia pseudomallei TaxID=28450 RepID=UPI00155FBEF0|nr:SR protein factor [Burkholderia pseudomallei]